MYKRDSKVRSGVKQYVIIQYDRLPYDLQEKLSIKLPIFFLLSVTLMFYSGQKALKLEQMSKSMCICVRLTPPRISVKYSLIAIKISDPQPCLQYKMVHFPARGFVIHKCQTTDGWI